jgi:hypothetical protein
MMAALILMIFGAVALAAGILAGDTDLMFMSQIYAIGSIVILALRNRNAS